VAAGRAVLAGAAQLINCVEEIRVLSATGYPQLLASAIARLGAKPGHKNLLVRVVLRDLDKTRTN
jgi:phenylalanyl-tRNA synthetase alpha chain